MEEGVYVRQKRRGSEMKPLIPMILGLWSIPALLSAQSVPDTEFRDTAVVPYFLRVNPTLAYFRTFHRHAAAPNMELLFVIGIGPKPEAMEFSRLLSGELAKEAQSRSRRQEVRGYTENLLGLFLVDTGNPNQVWELAILDDDLFPGALEVVGGDSSSVVLSVTTDYGMGPKWHKFFFDVESKRLLKQVPYVPARVSKILTLQDKLYFVSTFNVGKTLRAQGKPYVLMLEEKLLLGTWGAEGPAVVPQAEAQQVLDLARVDVERLTPGPFSALARGWNEFPPSGNWGSNRACRPFGASGRWFVCYLSSRIEYIVEEVAERTAEGYKLYPVPQSSREEHIRAFPERYERSRSPVNYTIQERIGPHEIVGDRFWFAKAFYDGEGISGVGGVGYFDPEKREYRVFSPPELAPWSATALYVDGDVVWVGLRNFGELVSLPQGLLRYDTVNGTARKYEIPEVIHVISKWNDAFHVGTDKRDLCPSGRGAPTLRS
jgi:hypothetical protein